MSDQSFNPVDLQLVETRENYTGSKYYGPLATWQATYYKGREQFNVRRVSYDAAGKMYSTGAGLTVNLDEKPRLLAALATVLAANGYEVKFKLEGKANGKRTTKLLCGGTAEHSTAKL